MLNEHDITDYTNEFAEYQPAGEPKKLYDLKRESVFKIFDESNFPEFFRLETIDGMYSRCWLLGGKDKAELVHLAVWTPVMEYIKKI